MFDPPFRWNLTNYSHLGSLINGEKAEVYGDFSNQLLHCCSRVLALAGNSDLIFVGRSPESIFDHLSGLLFQTSWFDRLELLQFSLRYYDRPHIRAQYPTAIAAMRSYLHQLNLHPQGLIQRPRPVAFIDLVATGDTFHSLIMILQEWSQETQVEWNDVRRKVRLVGITMQTQTSPKTWRWHQHARWTKVLQRGSIKNASIPADLWRYLGNHQLKVTSSYQPCRWGSLTAAEPTYDESHLKALRLAYSLFELGKMQERREEFTSGMTAEAAMKNRWFRALVQELRS